MAEDARQTADRAHDSAQDVRLDSWKEIAAHLRRDVTTVRRWEKREGLPVHRHLHERRDSVYAYTTEIEVWWQGRQNHLADNGALDGVTASAEEHSLASPVLAETAPRSPRATRARLAWILAATFAAATVALAGLLAFSYSRASPDEAAEVRFSIDPPEQTSFGTMSLSPDGRQLAFTATAADGKTLLWVRPLDTTAARSLPDTDGATFPFWSPDRQALGFFAAGKLWTVDLAGGTPRAVCEAPDGHGGAWNRDGIIVFAPGPRGPLFRVPATGGSPAPVTTVDAPGERGHVWPAFLPDGRRFLYLADSSQAEHHNLFVGAIDSNERRHILNLARSNAVYVQEGYLFFAHERRLVAQPFDTNRLVLTGKPLTLVDEVLQSGPVHKTDFSVSDSGVLAYRSLGGFDTRLVWRDRAGQESAVIRTPAEHFEPTLSPDESRIAVDVFDHRPSRRFGFNVAGVVSDIWVVDQSTAVASQFTADPGAEFDPVWSPDGRSIVFSSNTTDNLNLDLYRKNADGTGSAELLLDLPKAIHVQDWSPDGRFVVYATFDEKTRGDFWLLPMFGDRTPQPLLRTEFNEEQAQISPDGRWFAYTSQKSGRSEIYVRSFPTPGQERQISTTGGGDARWRADGKELFYIAEDRQLMAVPVKAATTFEHGPAVALFDTGMPPHWGEGRNHYDVSRDGRFLFMAPIADDRSSPFIVVLNWGAKLAK